MAIAVTSAAAPGGMEALSALSACAEAVEALAGPRPDAGGGPDEPPDEAVLEAGVDEAMPLAENGTVDGVR